MKGTSMTKGAFSDEVATPDQHNHYSTYPMHGEVTLRAPLIDGQEKMKGRIAAITFSGDGGQSYALRFADGTLLEVGVHEIDSDTT